jgi:hypothetical protein
MPWPLPLLAQVPPASQIDLLTQQIEFLQDANSRMADSFGQFVTLVNVAITLVVAFIGILEFSTRREIKQSLDGLVRAEVKKQLANTVKAQVEDLERIILREAVVGQTQAATPDDAARSGHLCAGAEPSHHRSPQGVVLHSRQQPGHALGSRHRCGPDCLRPSPTRSLGNGGSHLGRVAKEDQDGRTIIGGSTGTAPDGHFQESVFTDGYDSTSAIRGTPRAASSAARCKLG